MLSRLLFSALFAAYVASAADEKEDFLNELEKLDKGSARSPLLPIFRNISQNINAP